MGTIAKLSSRGKLKEFEQDYQRAQEKGEIPPTAELERLLAERAAALEKNGHPPPDENPPI
jgi:hypothetical protein